MAAIRSTDPAGCHPRQPGCAGLCSDDGLAAACRRHDAALLARARWQRVDHWLAEDVVQETYLRAWRACGSFDPAGPAPLRSWLYTIQRHVVIDMARARAVRPPLQLADARPVDVASADPGVVQVLALRTQPVDALRMISAEHRRVVLDAVIRDRPCRDVAAELGIPAGTVKSRLHYALRRLRELLHAQEQAA